MTQQEKTPTLPQGRDVLNWKIKTLARSPREMMITQSIFIAVYLTGSTLYMWGGWIMFSDSLYSLVGTVLALAGILAYFTGLLIRQKTIFNYTLKTDGATVEYYLTTPTSPPISSKASPFSSCWYSDSSLSSPDRCSFWSAR